MRLAWFSPFPPVRTGIAACSAELVAALARRGHDIDLYPESTAHDFVWRRRMAPYDLTVYQFGNSSHHDYEWAYALSYPGLTVLHDTHLHHARAAFLLRERRADDYRAEFRWNHPDVSPDLAELAIAGLDSRLFYEWGLARALVESSRLVAVHGEGARRELMESLPGATTPNATTPNSPINSQGPTSNSQGDLSERIVSIRLGHGQLVSAEREFDARRRVRSQYGIAEDTVLFGVFGGLTPEKRIPQILAAFRALLSHAAYAGARLLLAGAPAAHYDVTADIAANGLSGRVILTGYLESDEELTDHLAACDVTLHLRWPTARETSGPWLRALAAGKATILTDLVHLADVPSLDPRTWAPNSLFPTPNSQDAICVAVDLLDEDHSLRLAMRRLAADAELRARLGRAAREWWGREHSLEVMVEDYERVMKEAAARPDPPARLPAHMRNPGDRKLRALLEGTGVEAPI
jgi:glycosyltransferase involved in cell wall biosynthesis